MWAAGEFKTAVEKSQRNGEHMKEVSFVSLLISEENVP